MSEKTQADNMSVYEISYLIVSSIPDEKIQSEAEMINKIITEAGASIVSDEAPTRIKLAYEMRKKNVGGSYEKYTEAYFGWTKFEVGSDVVESIKKSVEKKHSVLRMLIVSTVKENTYLGKRAQTIASEIVQQKENDGNQIETALETEEKKDVPAISIEEMDKSIDEMVKEA